jgi:FAD/FMN-containing dehydrogenase
LIAQGHLDTALAFAGEDRRAGSPLAGRLPVVRGGGHNWCQPTLRNGGLLTDVKDLNKVISIDVPARKAVVQPIISNREIQKVLNAEGLAYPSGHCP